MALTAKQQRFAEEYLVDLNATQAAIRAGYSAKTAEVLGCRTLKHPEVAALIAAGRKEQQERTKITADRVIEELGKLAFANIHDLLVVDDDGKPVLKDDKPQYDVKKLTRETAAGIASISPDGKPTLLDKKGALDSLGRHFGLFTDKTELSGPVTVVVNKPK